MVVEITDMTTKMDEIKKSKAMKVTKQANRTRLHVEFMDLTKWKLSL